VGIVRNRIAEPILVAQGGDLSMHEDFAGDRARIQSTHEEVSEIRIDEELADILDGVEGYSHLMVLFWGDRVTDEGRTLTKVHPMGRKDFPLVGIFATRSPARPNPVLMTVVRLLERRGTLLEVTGLDAVDGSPVIDIKPYVREFYPEKDVLIPGWMQRIVNETREPE
jgi:tRNA-Thr(GGU) m(6)t(6)A37 methyltransferase TsaA